MSALHQSWKNGAAMAHALANPSPEAQEAAAQLRATLAANRGARLCPAPGERRLEYTPSQLTDIRKTLAAARRAVGWPEVAR